MEQIMAEMKDMLKASYEEMKAHQKRIMAIMEASLEEMKSVVERHPQWKLLEH
jgi:hypothetical protein